ncbi:2-methoxy-6-polyprenyl-1,4-benzoquinol methylase, mitochondrial [Austwickia sp. TVS 96-490-7B]|uniref:methyltransferase domain-containing protein n=1 Tax=Austwickia sp. TVS 96-490-7B TaxID=2830843 RepID=UPI001C581DA6|nr:methyltransferase domain-containing protein [Austwickia sp. TVS 96-490-7B]MBW3086954.1 2-methoxy-6-polyprenyl-1,4-benzoquinol methylase, mitochondrial [Austwickia sp. TVS 96-490-7B]
MSEKPVTMMSTADSTDEKATSPDAPDVAVDTSDISPPVTAVNADENTTTLAAYDIAAAAYLEHTPSEPSALAEWLAGMVGEVIAPGARVLEIGSAGGKDAAFLRDSGLMVQPTDAASSFVTHLRAHGFPDAVRYDVRRDAPPPGDWDIVFANAVLPHLRRRDVIPALRRLHDELGDETVLMCSVKIGDGEGWSTEKLGTLRWYTYWRPEEFFRAVRAAGWVVQESRLRAGRYDDWISVVALPERSALREAFDDRAETYRDSAWHRAFAEQFVDTVPLTEGMQVLDVATGTGFVADAVARAVGPRGRVTAVDVSEGMLAVLAEHVVDVDASSRAPIEVVLCDGTDLYLPDTCMDVVICGAGLLYMPVEVALAEWFRVLRPGGLVAFSGMRADEPPSWRLFRTRARAYGLDLPDPSASLGSPEACVAALERAGFTNAGVVEGLVPFTDADVSQAWAVHARMARHELIAVPEEDVARLRASYVAEVELSARSDPTFVQARTLYATARRP